MTHSAPSPFQFAHLPDVTLPGRPFRLTCEWHENPLGIDCSDPRFAWWVGDPRSNAIQSAYQLVVADSDTHLNEGVVLWDSGCVRSSKSLGIRYAGPALVSGQRYHWRVRTWNADGRPSEWSEAAWWEMGLPNADDWQARWIGASGRDTKGSAPALYLRKEFVVNRPVRAARLYVSARGIFEMSLNGKRIGKDYFVPGWTDYRKRNQYLTYNLTDELHVGRNVLGSILADGWHNGNLLLLAGGKKNWYGDDTSLFAQLAITYDDGTRVIVVTDGSWWTTSDGPIRSADLYQGEIYDARMELRQGQLSWDVAGFYTAGWSPAAVIDALATPPHAKVNPPVRKQESLSARSVRRTDAGRWIFDFGQNLSGWVRLKVRGPAGHEITLRFGEMLERDGSLHVANLRSARATDTYICHGVNWEEWEPRFTSHGFQYVEVAGIEENPDAGTVVAVVLHADLPLTGRLETSDPALNRLQANIWWSQRANTFDVPTDCPQRDERLGWTGDANFFLPTAAFNYGVASLFEKWMGDIRDAQGQDGRFTVYAPAPDGVNDAAAFSDGGVICPWLIYRHYGDTRILTENYDAMVAWIEYQRTSSNDLIRPESGFGDWLAPTGPDLMPTPKDLIATAYFAHTTDLMTRIARALGRTDDEQKYRELRDAIGGSFARKFIRGDGLPEPATATSIALTLCFDLLSATARAPALKHLVESLRARDWRVPTGFVGTPFLMRALKQAGRDDVAYHLLLQRGYPGWLYMVDQGATTIWERWNSWTPETGFGHQIADTGVGDVRMNSFNHTVWGAVGEWMYAVIGGIDIDGSEPGFSRIQLRPRPGGNLSWATAALDSPYGRIATDWRIEQGRFILDATVPPNTRASVVLPDGTVMDVGAGCHRFDCTLAR